MMAEVTQVLSAIEQGDPKAAAQLLPLVYEELRKLAAARLAQEKPGQTLQATALVHEAYLRLVDVEKAQQWNSRGHFFGAAAEAMRRILVEQARRKGREKHGGPLRRLALEDLQLGRDAPPDEMLQLDEVLGELARSDGQTARLVELHCFAGLSIEQAADLLGLPHRTAYRDWAYARAWLFRRIERAAEDPAP
jgi:RNA polymerase sigma factor (TIGR02999 family)